MIPIGPVVAKQTIAAQREALWAVISEPQRAQLWVPGLAFVPGRGEQVTCGERTGEFDVWVRGHVYGFRWAVADERATSVLLTLRSVADTTLVTITETGFDALPDGADRAAQAQTRWNEALRLLAEVDHQSLPALSDGDDAAASETEPDAAEMEIAPEDAVDAAPEAAVDTAPEAELDAAAEPAEVDMEAEAAAADVAPSPAEADGADAEPEPENADEVAEPEAAATSEVDADAATDTEFLEITDPAADQEPLVLPETPEPVAAAKSVSAVADADAAQADMAPAEASPEVEEAHDAPDGEDDPSAEAPSTEDVLEELFAQAEDAEPELDAHEAGLTSDTTESAPKKKRWWQF